MGNVSLLAIINFNNTLHSRESQNIFYCPNLTNKKIESSEG